jgi:protein-disulfide isomerase
MVLTRVMAGLVVFGAASCLLSGAEDGAAHPSGSVVLVEVNGAKLTMADLEKKSASTLFQARTNYYAAERKAIEGLVDDYLLDREAAKEGVTVSELLDRHVNSAIAKDPSEEALRVYYEGIDTTEPYAAVRQKIIDSLRTRRIAKAKAAYLQSLRSQASVVIRLAPPRAPISMKDVPVRGAANPRVTVLEYADFECPYCQQVYPILEKLQAEFKGKIAFAYKDFPLPMHADAEKAAEAAHCAGAQGKYWDYHDLLFTKKVLDVGSLKAYARTLKLDGSAFDACLDSGRMEPIVKDQAAEAQALGLQGTPSILVNGSFVSSAMTYDALHAVITEELSATGGSSDETMGSDARHRQ